MAVNSVFPGMLGAVLAAMLLPACSGGGGSASIASVSDSGSFTLAVTDAPVDTAQQVVVTFTGVSLKPADGEAITLTLENPASIDLLDFQDGDSEVLVEDELIEAGDYDWVRLEVDEANTFIVNALGAQFPLTIPSGAESGLKLNENFSLSRSGELTYIVDFDLRRSVHLTGAGNYLLRPALRIMEQGDAGTLAGEVDVGLITTHCTDLEDIPAVYVFDVGDSVDDLDGDAGDPVATVTLPRNGPYDFVVFPLEAATYTAVFTCDADQDTPEDGIAGTVNDDDARMTFVGEDRVVIAAERTTTHNFR